MKNYLTYNVLLLLSAFLFFSCETDVLDEENDVNPRTRLDTNFQDNSTIDPGDGGAGTSIGNITNTYSFTDEILKEKIGIGSVTYTVHYDKTKVSTPFVTDLKTTGSTGFSFPGPSNPGPVVKYEILGYAAIANIQFVDNQLESFVITITVKVSNRSLLPSGKYGYLTVGTREYTTTFQRARSRF